MTKRIFALLLLLAAPVFAVDTRVTWTTVTGRPTCTMQHDGWVNWASNATTTTCPSANGGSNILECVCVGSTGTWTSPAGGGGGTPSALLDGGTMHTDTTNSAATRGDIIVANSTPAWDDLAIGANGKVLKSNGTDPGWDFVAYSEVTGTPTIPTVYQYRVYNTTTNATPTELFTNGSSTQLSMSNSHTWTMDCLVSAYRTDATGGRASYRLEKGFYKNTTAGSLAAVAAQVKTVFGESDAAWDANILADTTSGNPYVQATGEAAKTIGWSAVCTISETP